jgi:glycerate dehydrogenase
MCGAWLSGQQYPELCREHRARAYVCAEFSLRRSICAYRESVLAGRWQESAQFCSFDYSIRDLAGSTLGVIGNGILGNSVAAIGRALGMNVLISAHKGRSDIEAGHTPLEEVLERSEVITLKCPLNAHVADWSMKLP